MVVVPPPASLALEKLGVSHKIFQHESPVTSLEQVAMERCQRASQIVRSILFRIAEDEFVMVLIAGSTQASWKMMRKHLGVSRITMATEDEVLAVTGYRVGTVSPFGLPLLLKVLIDPGVLEEEEISTGSGIRNTAIVLKSKDLRQVLKDAEVVSLIEEKYQG
jgi:prolyl-tRNA editing enzyme YbaK/EbsC (Cys-tRNA(Pro) deacylase)